MMKRVGFYIFLLVLLAGCASRVSPEIREYQRAVGQAFEDELDSLQPRNADEAAIKAILRKIKEAYAGCDKTLLKFFFSHDYTQAVFVPPSKAMKISRAAYFTGLAMGKVKKNRCATLERRLLMAKIRLVKPEGSPDRIDVVSLTTYASRYFKPRFIETFIFRRRNGQIELAGRAIVPLYPKSPEHYQAEIYIGDMSEFEKHKRDLQNLAWEDGDIFIDRILRKHTYQDLPVDNKPKSVVLLFREPLPPGAKIRIAHWYYNKRGDLQSSFEENHTVEKVNPWFFLVTQSTIFAMGDVDYEVFVDETKVLDRRYGTTWVTY